MAVFPLQKPIHPYSITQSINELLTPIFEFIVEDARTRPPGSELSEEAKQLLATLSQRLMKIAETRVSAELAKTVAALMLENERLTGELNGTQEQLEIARHGKRAQELLRHGN